MWTVTVLASPKFRAGVRSRTVSTVIALKVTSVAADTAQCYINNSWWCTPYWSDYRSDLTEALVQHVWITVVSVAIGLLIALGITALFRVLAHVPIYPVLSIESVLIATLSSSFVGLVFVPKALADLVKAARRVPQPLRRTPEDGAS